MESGKNIDTIGFLSYNRLMFDFKKTKKNAQKIRPGGNEVKDRAFFVFYQLVGWGYFAVPNNWSGA